MCIYMYTYLHKYVCLPMYMGTYTQTYAYEHMYSQQSL